MIYSSKKLGIHYTTTLKLKMWDKKFWWEDFENL